MATIDANKGMRCPECDTEFAELDTLGDPSASARGPNIGDVAVCAVCATITRYTEGGQMRVVPPDEFASLSPDLRESLEACQVQVLHARTANIVPSRNPEEIRRVGVAVALKVSDYEADPEGPPEGAVKRKCKRCKSDLLAPPRADLPGMIFLCPDCVAELVRPRQN